MAAQELKRRWIGIDITHLAISLIRSRLKEIHVARMPVPKMVKNGFNSVSWILVQPFAAKKNANP